jgi:hypothetical protein
MRILAAVLLAIVTSAPGTFAQTPALPRGVIGVTVTRASTDASERMRLGSEGRPWIYSGELSVRLAPRLAIGGEAIDLGIATGETAGQSFRSTGEQQERAVVALMRVRINGRERLAFDVVGGAGALFQRHTAMQAPCFSGCAATFASEFKHVAPVYFAGADVPIRLGRHFSIAAISRYYWLRRGDNTPQNPREPLPWQFEHKSSSRLAVGAAARVTW